MNAKTKVLKSNTLEITLDYANTGDEFWFLLQSDVHFDNPKCNRKLYFKHLDQAKERNAGILCFGDFFCLMQGRFDKRASKGSVRNEHKRDDYLDYVIEDSADLLKDYADNFLLFSDGNHETQILNRLESNPLTRMVDRLNYKHGGNVHKGDYQGFVNFRFVRTGDKVAVKPLFYHHGNWGGIISKGTQSVTRFAAIVPDADIVVSGHTHDSWWVPQARFRQKKGGQVVVEQQHHVKTGTYKEEFESGRGWAVEKITMPKILGAIWMRFTITKLDDIQVDFMQAS